MKVRPPEGMRGLDGFLFCEAGGVLNAMNDHRCGSILRLDQEIREWPPSPARKIIDLAKAFIDEPKEVSRETSDVAVCKSARDAIGRALKRGGLGINEDIQARNVLDAALRIYSDESIYKTLNERLRTSKGLKCIEVDAVRVQLPCLLGNLDSFGQLLLEAVHSLRPEAAEPVDLFRGGKLSTDALREIRSHIGEVVALTSFSSFSVCPRIARQFRRLAAREAGGSETAVLFRLRSSGRGRLGGFGEVAFRKEDEVLLPPFSTMVIEGVTQDGDSVVIDLIDLPALLRPVEPESRGAFKSAGSVGDGFLWLNAAMAPDFEGAEWTRIAKDDFEVLAKFDKSMRTRRPRPPGEILDLVPVACEGLRKFDVQSGGSSGETAAKELERVQEEEKDKDRGGRAVLDAALRLSNTKELGSPTVAIFHAINERLRRATSLEGLSTAAVESLMRELLDNLWAYAELLVEAVHALRPSEKDKGERGTLLYRVCTIMRSTFDEFRTRLGQAVACSSFMSLTREGRVSAKFADRGSLGADRVRALFVLNSWRRPRLGGCVKELESEDGVVLPPFSTFVVERIGRRHAFVEIWLTDVQLISPHWRLFVAAEAGDVAAIRRALSATPGVVDVRDERRRTLLHFSAWNDRADVVRVLLECGAYPDPISDLGRTPLCYAAYNGAASAVKALLAGGCDRSIRSGGRGPSPLDIAVGRRHDRACAALLAGGGDERAFRGYVQGAPEERKGRLLDALEPVVRVAHSWAMAGDAARVAALTGRYPELLQSTWWGTTLLQNAARYGESEVMKLLLGMGCDPTAVDGRGWSTMHYAYTAMAVRVLLACKAELEQQDDKGKTPLFTSDSPARVKVLLAAGAQVDARTKKGATPLIRAASDDGVLTDLADVARVARLLIHYHAVVDAQNDDGQTPLMCAAWRGHTDIARALLEAGANPKIVCRDGAWKGLTAVEIAVNFGRVETVELLGGDAVAVVHAAAAAGDVERLTRFRDQLPVLQSLRRGESVLSRALANGQMAFAEQLLHCGVNCNAHDTRGWSELHRQAWEGRSRAVEFLLRSGADPAASVRDRDKPLIHWIFPDDPWFGRTPMEMAAAGGHVECVEVLNQGRKDRRAEFSLAVAEACA
jgi:ankyrin repeat protein